MAPVQKTFTLFYFSWSSSFSSPVKFSSFSPLSQLRSRFTSSWQRYCSCWRNRLVPAPLKRWEKVIVVIGRKWSSSPPIWSSLAWSSCMALRLVRSNSVWLGWIFWNWSVSYGSVAQTLSIEVGDLSSWLKRGRVSTQSCVIFFQSRSFDGQDSVVYTYNSQHELVQVHCEHCQTVNRAPHCQLNWGLFLSQHANSLVKIDARAPGLPDPSRLSCDTTLRRLCQFSGGRKLGPKSARLNWLCWIIN